MPTTENHPHPAVDLVSSIGIPRILLRLLSNAHAQSSWQDSYLPDRFYVNVVSRLFGFGSQSLNDEDFARHVYCLNMVMPYLAAPSVYRFDEELLNELYSRNIDDASVDDLLRLREWCPYIELPPIDGTLGAWLTILDDPTPGYRRLQISLLHPTGKDGIYPISHCLIPLKRKGSGQTVAQAVGKWANGDKTRPEKGAVMHVLRLALYLCEPKIDITQHGREVRPPNRRAIKNPDPTRRPKTEIWEVGYRVGPEIKRARIVREQQEARQAEDAAAHRGPVRPHLRRAHQRLVPVGPRKRPDGTPIPASMRHHVARQIARIQVHGDRLDEMPVMIRNQILVDGLDLGQGG